MDIKVTGSTFQLFSFNKEPKQDSRKVYAFSLHFALRIKSMDDCKHNQSFGGLVNCNWMIWQCAGRPLLPLKGRSAAAACGFRGAIRNAAGLECRVSSFGNLTLAKHHRSLKLLLDGLDLLEHRVPFGTVKVIVF